MPSTNHGALPAPPPLPFTAWLFSADAATRARLVAQLQRLQQPDFQVNALASFTLDDPVLEEQPPDLFVIDVGAPIHGADEIAETIRHVRRRWPSAGLLCFNVPTSAAAVELLNDGADEALTRDAPSELVSAHVAAAVRRVQLANAQLRIAFGDLVYDRESRRVWCAGHEVQLTPRELRLFDILFLRAGAPVSVDTLYDYVWHDEGARASNSLAVYVGYLRRKLTGSRVAVLETLRGQGYRLSRRRE